jgi:GDPmannose 4,6-dehydratase
MGDASKAHSTLGWKPKVSFEQLVSMMYEHDLAEESGRSG